VAFGAEASARSSGSICDFSIGCGAIFDSPPTAKADRRRREPRRGVAIRKPRALASIAAHPGRSGRRPAQAPLDRRPSLAMAEWRRRSARIGRFQWLVTPFSIPCDRQSRPSSSRAPKSVAIRTPRAMASIGPHLGWADGRARHSGPPPFARDGRVEETVGQDRAISIACDTILDSPRPPKPTGVVASPERRGDPDAARDGFDRTPSRLGRRPGAATPDRRASLAMTEQRKRSARTERFQWLATQFSIPVNPGAVAFLWDAARAPGAARRALRDRSGRRAGGERTGHRSSGPPGWPFRNNIV
jgi:hypothetical protein